MPIINLHSTAPGNTTDISQMMKSIRAASSEALETPLSNVWVNFTPLQYYLNENDNPYVIIYALQGRDVERKNTLAKVIAENAGKYLLINPKKVWIYYQELEPSQVWF